MSIIGMPTEEMLTNARAFQSATFDRIAAIKRSTGTRDSRGGKGRSAFSTIGTVRCRLVDQGVTFMVGADNERVTVSNRWIVTMPAGTDVLITDRIEIDEVTYQVAEIHGGGNWETARRVTVTKG